MKPSSPDLAGVVKATRYVGAFDRFAGPLTHVHAEGQLLLSMQGIVACSVAGRHWIVPPHCALWIPAGIRHESRASANAGGYTLFIAPQASLLPRGCCMLRVSAMLREMIIELSERQAGHNASSRELLVRLLLEELASMPRTYTHFPNPSDPRLKRVAEALIAEPHDRRTLGQWARYAGMSERTLSRQLFKDTGMSFSRWRQQLRLMVALQALAQGRSVQQVTDDLGYESATSFITMFRQALGTTPARYRTLFEQPGKSPAGETPDTHGGVVAVKPEVSHEAKIP